MGYMLFISSQKKVLKGMFFMTCARKENYLFMCILVKPHIKSTLQQASLLTQERHPFTWI